MKFVVISDTHGHHREISMLPPGDGIIHAGDVSLNGQKEEIIDFLNWYGSLKYKFKILIAGNHDRFLENIDHYKDDFFTNGIIYLNDSGVEINGLKIWGSPVQPAYKSWAFNRSRGDEIRKHWSKIPDEIDILITHGPSYSKRDRTTDGMNVGCKDLLERINSIKPRYHICGHIHESYGSEKDRETGVIYINASLVNKKKILRNAPIAFSITTKKDVENRRRVRKRKAQVEYI